MATQLGEKCKQVKVRLREDYRTALVLDSARHHTHDRAHTELARLHTNRKRQAKARI